MSNALYVIETPALLTIYEVSAQAVLWQEQLTQSDNICWSLAALVEFDAAGLQLLFAMARNPKIVQADIKPPQHAELANWLMPKLAEQQGGCHA